MIEDLIDVLKPTPNPSQEGNGKAALPRGNEFALVKKGEFEKLKIKPSAFASGKTTSLYLKGGAFRTKNIKNCWLPSSDEEGNEFALAKKGEFEKYNYI